MLDVIVVGVGGMGSSTAYHLARRGVETLALEQFDLVHDRGSSHGSSRIIRLPYWEHPSYVPLVLRALELWRELEVVSGETLLATTGSIDAGPERSPMIQGSLAACRHHVLPYEYLTAAELRGRFPAFRLPERHVAVFQPNGGILIPEKCIAAYANAARSFGARIHTAERVIDWTSAGSVVRVRTELGEYESRCLVFTAGPWTPKLVGGLDMISVERQVMLWTEPTRPEWFQPSCFPVFYMQVDEGRFYGFPLHDIPAFKMGKYHHRMQEVDPDTVDRDVDATDEAVLREAIDKYFPDANGPTVKAKVCLFSNTRDEHFIIDVVHASPRVAVAAGFSGHGFKFCSVVGEILADLILDGRSRHDTSLFALRRFAVQ
jgi:sarcosine oxidase